MKPLPIVVLSLAVCTPAAAQAETVPPGFLNRAASAPGAGSWKLGAFADMRMQICNGHLTGGAPRSISMLSFRQDAEFTWRTAAARSYGKVAVRFAHADIDKLTMTFNQNYIGAPTTVFSGPLSMPDLTSPPTSRPAPFYRPGLSFVCQTPFLYSARQDLLLELEMRGGVMANAAPWGKALNYGYHLDGVTSLTSAQGSAWTVGLDGNQHPCVHDGSRSTWGGNGPESKLQFTTYAPKTGTANFDDRISYQFSVAGLPAATSCLQVASLGGTIDLADPRFPVVPGLGCQNLMVDLGLLLTTHPLRSNAGGTAETPLTYVPFHPALEDVKIYTQAAWNDSQTGTPKLTRVCRSIIPGQPMGKSLRGTLAYTYDINSAYSFGIVSTGVPLYRIN